MRELLGNKRAATALEYALVAGVLVATIVFGFNLLANNLSLSFSAIGASL